MSKKLNAKDSSMSVDTGLGDFIEDNDEKFDLVELTYKYYSIEKELEELIEKEIGKGGYLGFCHLYWKTKKRILKEKYNIDWKSPAELNPHILYD